MKRTGSPDPDLVARVDAAVRMRGGKDERNEVRFLCPEHDDHHPSARWNNAKATWTCDACKAGGGCTDLAKTLGVELHETNGHVATPPRSKTLAEYQAESEGTSAKRGKAARSTVSTGGSGAFPFFPKVAESLGWKLVDRKGQKCLEIVTQDADGKPARTKIRGPRNSDGKLFCRFTGEGVEGFANFNALTAARLEFDEPLVLLVSGETDLLAVEHARRAEGVEAAIVSATKGEGSPLGDLAKAFKDCRVVVVGDADEAGRREAPKRAAEIEAAGAKSVRVVFPPTSKDAREFISNGGTLREVLDAPDSRGEPRVWTLAELEETELPKPEAFVGDELIVRGRVTLLVSSPKIGKSIGCLHLAKSVAAGPAPGATWLGSEFTDLRTPVLYLCAEGGPYAAQERSRIVPPHGAIKDVHLVVDRPFPRLDTAEGLATLARLVDRTGAGVVIADPISRFRSLEDENDNAEAQRFADGILAFAETHKVAVLLVHHPGRTASAEGTSGSFGGGRGASALFAAVDVEIALRRDPKTREIHATFEQRFGRPIDPGRRLRRDPKTLILEHVGDLGGTAGRVGADGVTPARCTVSLGDFKAALQPVGSTHTRDDVLTAMHIVRSTLDDRLRDWTPALGDELLIGREQGRHGRTTYQLVDVGAGRGSTSPARAKAPKRFKYLDGDVS